jgi:hypothetical protein
MERCFYSTLLFDMSRTSRAKLLLGFLFAVVYEYLLVSLARGGFDPSMLNRV